MTTAPDSGTVPGSLAEALAVLQGRMPAVARSRTADTGSYRYRYADLADVVQTVSPLMSELGLAFVCLPGVTDDGRLVLRGRLWHRCGEQVEGVLPLSGGTPQALGSSITYMRRYLLGCLTGVVTDDDDDGRAARRHAQPGRPSSGRDWQAVLDTAAGLDADGLRRMWAEEDLAHAPEPVRRRFTALAQPAQPTAAEPTSTADDPSMVTPAQLRMIHATTGGHGIHVRDEVHRLLAHALGRPVGSAKDMTRDEASRVIKWLSNISDRAMVEIATKNDDEKGPESTGMKE